MTWWRMVALVVAATMTGATAWAQQPVPAEPAPADAGPAEVEEAEGDEEPEGAADPVAPVAPVAPTSEPDPQAQAEADLSRELRTVEEDVSNLKERVFRSKATLKLLKELVVDPAISGARLAVWHVNKLGGGYTMESAQYFLDGKSVFNKLDTSGGLDTVPELKVVEQTVPAGTHTLQVNLVLRGKGYKLFSYLRSYQFKVTSSYTFDVEEGRVTVLRVLADSRGGLRNFVDRPTIRYDERTESFRED